MGSSQASYFKYNSHGNGIWFHSWWNLINSIYHKCIFVYVDNVFIVWHCPQDYLSQMQGCHRLNPTSMGPPQLNLGVEVEKSSLPVDSTGKKHWSFPLILMFTIEVKNVSLVVQDNSQGLQSTAKLHFQTPLAVQKWILLKLLRLSCWWIKPIFTPWWCKLLGCWAVELWQLDSI